MQQQIDTLEEIVIQIATPYSTGTGVYIGEYDLIVTNEHVVRGFKEVVADGCQFHKQMIQVVLLDERLDLAVLSAPLNHNMPTLLLDNGSVHEGDSILAAGHPFDLKFTATKGIVSSLKHNEGEIQYIQHDAALNPGNSGGPLMSDRGTILGLNTFVFEKGQSIGFTLPTRYIKSVITDYVKSGRKPAVKCSSCNLLSLDEVVDKVDYCQQCGTSIKYISDILDYEPYGISHTVETMIKSLGYEVPLTRKGPFNWRLTQGTATVDVSYYEKTGLLVGDAIVCTLPNEQIVDVYTFLLQKNFYLEGLTFALKGNEVVLSMLVFDQFLKMHTLVKLFKNLLDNADEMDNHIVNTFGANWKVN